MYKITMILCARGPDAFGHIVDDAPRIEFVGSYSQAHRAIMRVASLYNRGLTNHFIALVAEEVT